MDQRMMIESVLLGFDLSLQTTAIVIHCLALACLSASRFNLTGYRCLLISLSFGDLLTCIVNLLTIANWNWLHAECASSTALTLLRTVCLLTSLVNISGLSIEHLTAGILCGKWKINTEFRSARTFVFLAWALPLSLAVSEPVVRLVQIRTDQAFNVSGLRGE